MLLAIDTSSRLVGIALYDGFQVAYETVWNSQNYHTVELAPAIEKAFERTGIKASALQSIGVATGPGSFTGLRIGLAIAKGLALSNRLSLVGLPTLDYLAAAQPLQNLALVAVLQAGRGRLAAGWYRCQDGAWVSDGTLEITDIQNLAARIQSPTWVCGELNEEERTLLARKRKNVLLASPAQSLRRPSYLAEISWQRWRSGQVDDPVSLSPLYLHIGEPIPG